MRVDACERVTCTHARMAAPWQRGPACDASIWLADAGPIVQEEAATRANVQQLRSHGSGAGDAAQPRVNFCRKCVSWKPVRAHHCSVSGRCVLKLDHYCLWIVNAVGLLNHKFFLLFLFYTTLACLEAAAALIPIAIRRMLSDDLQGSSAGIILFTAIFTFAFGVALIMFLLMHWDMLSKNYTSIESIDHQVAASWPHDRGLQRNVVEVFGRRCACLRSFRHEHR